MDDVITLTGRLSDRDAWTAERCSVGRALDVVGTRSAMMVLREALYGTRRFEEFARRAGISEPVTAARLRELVQQGLLTRRPYQEAGRRTRDEYELTEMGRELSVALVALMQWGDRWLAPDGAPITLVHADCGQPIAAELRCRDGHQADVGDLQARPGPGASSRQPSSGATTR